MGIWKPGLVQLQGNKQGKHESSQFTILFFYCRVSFAQEIWQINALVLNFDDCWMHLSPAGRHVNNGKHIINHIIKCTYLPLSCKQWWHQNFLGGHRRGKMHIRGNQNPKTVLKTADFCHFSFWLGASASTWGGGGGGNTPVSLPPSPRATTACKQNGSKEYSKCKNLDKCLAKIPKHGSDKIGSDPNIR